MKPSTLSPPETAIDYRSLLSEAEHSSIEAKAKMFFERLPELWKAAYLTMTPREAEIYFVRHGSFQYLFDHPMQPADHPNCESRLVAAFGHSQSQCRARDDFRLKGWVGPTETWFGRNCDKGHFIAHSIGGAVDQCELNVFVQRRDLNRGWSDAGKRFRRMEAYCVCNPGTFCFSRPIYMDGSAKPATLEFGVLKADGELWVESFDNR